jgi:hypothetical protein
VSVVTKIWISKTHSAAAERAQPHARWRNSPSTLTLAHMRTTRPGVSAAARGAETREHRPAPHLGGARTPEQLVPRLVNKANTTVTASDNATRLVQIAAEAAAENIIANAAQRGPAREGQ